ncbi:MAG TPA: urea transporter [Polyangiaceae bacterium]
MPASGFIQAILRAYASVLFIPSAATGLLMLAATFFEPSAGVCGVVAVTTALAIARRLGYQKEWIDTGFFGVNSLLCGLGVGHGHVLTPGLLLVSGLVGVIGALLTAVLSGMSERLTGLPVLALPFVVTMSLLWPALHGYSSGPAAMAGRMVPDLPVALPAFAQFALRTCGSILLIPSTTVGCVVALALVLHSRIAAVFGLIGVALALCLGTYLGPHADPSWVQAAGYNALLTSMAVGAIFFVPSSLSLFWALISACTAVGLTFAMEPTAARIGCPVLAWPFVSSSFAILGALGLRDPRRGPEKPLSAGSPEKNLRLQHVLGCRFNLPCPARMNVPVRGTWSITQGFEGQFTHQGRFRHALDFEILDANGFPFSGAGVMASEYYAFGERVYAPLAGTVVFAYGEHEDNRPGEQNLLYPYGNVVIIQHGFEIYSVLAHLQRGSVGVIAGQRVAAGEAIARVGASGRSPRPHLHLQVQASPTLGVPTIPFELTHYAVSRATVAKYVSAGIPSIGDRVSGCAPLTIREIGPLRVGAEFCLRDVQNHTRRIRSELSPTGERYLLDVETEERLYFGALDGVPTFATLKGSPRSALAAIALALPRVPPFGGAVRSRESIPAEWLLPNWLLPVHDLLRIAGLGVSVLATCSVNRDETELTSESRYEIHWLWFVFRTVIASLRIEGAEVTYLEVCRRGRVALQMSRASLPPQTPVPFVRRIPRLRLETVVATLAIPLAASIAATSLLLSTAPVTAKARVQPLEDSYQFERSGDLPKAIIAAAKTAAANPKQYFPLLRLAYLEQSAKRFALAAEHYAAASELAPRTVEPKLGQLLSLIADSQYEAALQVADQVLAIDPQNYLARSRKAWALYHLGRYASAVDEYSAVIELYPGDVDMRLGRAYSLSGSKRVVEAAMEFRAVLERVPNDARAKAALGMP